MHNRRIAMKETRPHAVFVTGTDTGIGKTYVCALLAQALSERLSVSYLKPVQTGCDREKDGQLRAPDFEVVLGTSRIARDDYAVHVPYRFVPACSPHLAARQAGTGISLDRPAECLALLGKDRTTVIVEGAGGVLVPLNQRDTIADLMLKLALPVVVVTSPRLGTLNHTFLTLEALDTRGLRLAGLVFNNAEGLPKDAIYIDNRELLRSRAAPAPLLELDRGESLTPAVRAFRDELIGQFL